MAACSHPFFKLNWIEDEKKRKGTEKMIDGILEKLDTTVTKPDNRKSQNSFFKFSQPQETKNTEFLIFSKSKTTDLKMLENFPNIKKLFIRYNAALPSSASVERLFSAAGLILTAMRSRLSDEHFEQHLLLKINKQYIFS